MLQQNIFSNNNTAATVAQLHQFWLMVEPCLWFNNTQSISQLSNQQPESTAINADKNSSGDEIANVNFYAVRPEGTRIRWNNANNGHYAFQGHSRSSILVQIESSYTTSY